MKTKVFIAWGLPILIASLLAGGSAFARKHSPSLRTIEPIVSTGWLQDNIDQENLVIIDIRSDLEYGVGHIPGSINKPFGFPVSAWITVRDGLYLEVPDETALFGTISDLGITGDSWVVIVTAPSPAPTPVHYGLANATRVALTLIYAGIVNAAILDGGYPKWMADGFEVTTEETEIPPVTYEGKVNQDIFVSIEYVRKHLKKSGIIDARDADQYFGATIDPWTGTAGHIPKATSLPAPWIWQLNVNNGTYTYKNEETLGAMASGVLREPWGDWAHSGQEIIVYCSVGGYASSWWFVLTQVLNYRNVKMFDGAAQEWVRDYDTVLYQWE